MLNYKNEKLNTSSQIFPSNILQPSLYRKAFNVEETTGNRLRKHFLYYYTIIIRNAKLRAAEWYVQRDSLELGGNVFYYYYTKCTM